MNDLMVRNETKISPWEKPGGKLGLVVAGIATAGGLVLLYNILPFLITLTTNMLTLTLLVLALAAIAFLITDKRFRKTFSMVYFLVMRKITGLIIEIDPIAIVEQKVKEMKQKIGDIQTQLGKVRGLITNQKRRLNEKESELKHQFDLLQEYKQVAGKKLEIKKLNPKPDTDAEDSANLDGISGKSLDVFGDEQIYLGLAVSCGNRTEAIPFLSPDREKLLEYDLTRAIVGVKSAKKPKVGVISALKIMGGYDNPMAMMQGI